MKCEVCGFQVSQHPGPDEPGRQAFDCAVCGRWFCSDHAAPFYNCRREQPMWLCPEHRQRAVEYIESLKPKPKVDRYGEKYRISGTPWWWDSADTVLLSTSAANALYDHIKRERGENA